MDKLEIGIVVDVDSPIYGIDKIIIIDRHAWVYPVCIWTPNAKLSECGIECTVLVYIIYHYALICQNIHPPSRVGR